MRYLARRVDDIERLVHPSESAEGFDVSTRYRSDPCRDGGRVAMPSFRGSGNASLTLVCLENHLACVSLFLSAPQLVGRLGYLCTAAARGSWMAEFLENLRYTGGKSL